MKIAKRWLAVWLAVIMVFGLSACDSSKTEKDAGGEGETKASDSKDIPTVKYSYLVFNNLSNDVESVEEAINAYTVEKIGVKVDLVQYDISSYQEQMNLQISSGEDVGLFVPLDYSTAVVKGQIMDITDLLATYAPETKELVGDEWLKASSTDGRVYAVPAYKGVALQTYALMRKDIVEELGIDLNSIHTLKDLGPVFEKVHAAYPDMYCMAPLNANNYYAQDGFMGASSGYFIDAIGGRRDTSIGALAGKDSQEVINYYKSDSFKDTCSLMYDWTQKGYLMPETSVSPDVFADLCNAGRAFSTIGMWGNTAQSTASMYSDTYDLVAVNVEVPYMTTTEIGVSWALGTTCENPEAAMKFLNLTYTDPYVINLIIWGIEGRDYVLKEDGTAGYPEGQSADTVPYTAQLTCGVAGSQFIQYQLEGSDPEDLSFMDMNNKESEYSSAFGFRFNADPVKIQYTAVTNVISKYYNGLTCGELDPSTTLDKFYEELDSAGINEIIAEMQTQLDAWRSTAE